MPIPSQAAMLRAELSERAHLWAAGRLHVESYGQPPVVVFAPEERRHGNFYQPAYREIMARPGWRKRFDKVHAQGRSLPNPAMLGLEGRKWRELDSAMSSDALLMNFFCTPEFWQAETVRRALGVEEAAGEPEFGWRARVSLANGKQDRTEVDMRWGDLLVEAKLTEADFQTREVAVVEGYRDFSLVLDESLLARTEVRTARRRRAAELAEEFSQEWEPEGGEEAEAVGREFRAALEARDWEARPAVGGYRHYQLIRNVLAAEATGGRFVVFLDRRRPELMEAWFEVMAAVREAGLRTRLQMMSWQELAGLAPAGLREFMAEKYGIEAE
jgi:hypothetical protein